MTLPDDLFIWTAIYRLTLWLCMRYNSRMKRPLGRLNKNQRRIVLIITVGLILVAGSVAYVLYKNYQNQAQNGGTPVQGATSRDASEEEAITSLDDPIAKAATDAEKATLYGMRIQRLEAASDYKNAIETTELLIKLQPDVPAHYGQLGSLYRMTAEKQKAVEALKKAVSLAESGGDNGRYAADVSYYKDLLTSAEGDSE